MNTTLGRSHETLAERFRSDVADDHLEALACRAAIARDQVGLVQYSASTAVELLGAVRFPPAPPRDPYQRAPLARHAYSAAVDDRATLTQARSMLFILLAACKQTEVALQAAANVLDTDLTHDLSTMIERSERELLALNAKIDALPH